MAKDSDPLAGVFETKESGLFSGLLAEEQEFDRRALWRLGSWGVAAIAAVVVAVMTNQAQISWRHDELAAAALTRQADRLQALTKDSQNETRRLASAIETLNADRDRLYSRVTVLEQGLDSVTGAIVKQGAAASAPQAPAKPANAEPAAASTAPQSAPSPAPAPSVAPVTSAPSPSTDKPRAEAAKEQPSPPPQSASAASLVASSQPVQSAPLPAVPLVASKSIMAPPDPAASKLIQPEQPATPQAEPDPPAQAAAAPVAKEGDAATATTEEEAPAPSITVQQTRFAVDLGSANSIDGLRAMWRGLIKSNPEIAALRPIIMIKEGKTGPGMQLRLGAGPLVNAAAAAKFCAALVENGRPCETTVFDGQRLSVRGDAPGPQGDAPVVTAKSDGKPENKSESKPEIKPEKPQHRRSWSSTRRPKREEPAPQQSPPPQAQTPAKPESTSALSSFFRRN
jgi:hypothetical protein